MTGVGFIILFGLSSVWFTCQGEITSPPVGTSFTFLRGSNATIIWLFDDDISSVGSRVWRFTSSDGSFNAERLARIIDNSQSTIDESGLSGVTIVKPATLILKNVNQTYNGTYQFTLEDNRGVVRDSDVVVFIAITPAVTVNCSSPTTLIAGDYFSCECKGQGGNPPAEVTWYNGSVPIVTGKEIGILRLPNVGKYDHGNYKCEARSHEKAKNETTVEIIVNFQPMHTTIVITPEKAEVGGSVNITCSSEGRPEPRYNITYGGTVVSTGKMYTISKVNMSHAGPYECIAWNKIGRESNSRPLIIEENGDDDGALGVGPITGIVIGVLVLVSVVIVIVVVWRCKLKEKDGHRGNAGVRPGGSTGPAVNQYELDGEPTDGVYNAYDTVNSSGTSGSENKPAENTLSPVHVAVEKSNDE